MQELQMISEIIGNLSGDATTAFIIYLVYRLVCFLAGIGMGAGIAFGAYKATIAAIHKTSFYSQIANTTGTYTPFNRGDEKIILEILRKGMRGSHE